MTNHRQYSSTPEARKVAARNLELPHCEGLRVCAALTSILQFFLVSKRFPNFDLTIPVQVGFGLIGFMTAAYLLRDRDLTTRCEVYESDGMVASVRRLIRAIPIPQMVVVIAVVLVLPHLFSMDSIPVPDMAEVPAMIVRFVSSYFADFQKSDFDGRTLLLFPIVILLIPRRLLSLVLLSVLGSGLVLQFAGMYLGSLRPSSILVAFSAFDLLSAGTFLAVITRQGKIGRSEAQIGISAVLAGLILALVLVGARLLGGGSSGGAFTFLSAPVGFGVGNFVVEIVATTLVSSLWWRDLAGMIEGVKRVPVH
jgi:hypothetical protein